MKSRNDVADIAWGPGFVVGVLYCVFRARVPSVNETLLICMVTLWYSRHPIYFGESLVWWGIYLVCVSGGCPYWTAIGPMILTFLLLRVSGVPMLEKKYENNEEYKEYQTNTSAFIPWIPKV